MSPNDLARYLEVMREAGITNADFTRLHHFSMKERVVYLSNAISYFESKRSLQGNNLTLADRCKYVADQIVAGRIGKETLLNEALARWPLSQTDQPEPTPVRSIRQEQPGEQLSGLSKSARQASRQLGDAGEEHAAQLLRQHGYIASLMTRNFPTYDIQASGTATDFLVSVKVARARQHLRLGSRKSVDRLSTGNFIFAYLPNSSNEVCFVPGGYRLLILPAVEVRDYALPVHDSYWSKKGRTDGYSVMIKAYDRNHIDVWNRWSSAYENAWHILPAPRA